MFYLHMFIYPASLGHHAMAAMAARHTYEQAEPFTHP